ncbi:stress-responsive transcriptional regulator [Stenotrophomonas maltophilia]|jgi:phage shock protein C|uniref:PspC domain-containing protein n=2 Tax=Gammaproteobacteria TaxID=1236 RepID=A0A3P3QTV6_9GAMM|nr:MULTISPECIES: PspC domain-containing protein [Gammaproteobacteria]KKL01035.1 stress-responsive transcriptional regulator [Rheinheimera mesophila]PAM65919.1 stress-responsive transcriptional regulator [Stenotrophomonas maltophilia]RRJ23780.1 PspC domain-containing protein [Rheinheimera mesophila]
MRNSDKSAWFVNKAKRKISGVCAGFAAYYDQPIWVIRALVVVMALYFPVAVLVAYIAAALILPERWVY